MKELKSHREYILFNRQLSLLPQTQGAVESYRECEELTQNIKSLEEQISHLSHLKLRAEGSWRYHNAVWHGYSTGQPQVRREFVRRCPCDGCKGFLSTAWKCGVCSKHICKECNEEKEGDEHVCKPENVETVKLLNKDTKGCPKCGTLIFKISGCSQMWCPDCHTAFNWNTMAIETGVIHNPHFFEFQRGREREGVRGGGGRNLADIPCGGLPTTREILGLCERRGALIPDHNAQILMDIVRGMHHIEHHEIPIHQNNQNRNWVVERVNYMVNKLEEADFKKLLQRHEKTVEKNRDIVGVLRMILNVVSDLMRQLVVDSPNYGEYMEEVTRVREYANGALMQIGNRYNNKSLHISRVWELMKV